MRQQTLPVAYFEKGHWVLTEPYEPDNRITCRPYGEMNDGTLVWVDDEDNQYTRIMFYGKYYFCKM